MLKYNFSLSKKLFILICIVLLLIILPLFYISKTSLTQFGLYAHTVNEKQIKSMSNFYLSRIVTEQARSYDEVFKKIKAVSSLLGRQLTCIYDDIDALSKTPIKGMSNLELNPENKLFFSPLHEAVINVYWGGVARFLMK